MCTGQPAIRTVSALRLQLVCPRANIYKPHQCNNIFPVVLTTVSACGKERPHCVYVRPLSHLLWLAHPTSMMHFYLCLTLALSFMHLSCSLPIMLLSFPLGPIDMLPVQCRSPLFLIHLRLDLLNRPAKLHKHGYAQSYTHRRMHRPIAISITPLMRQSSSGLSCARSRLSCSVRSCSGRTCSKHALASADAITLGIEAWTWTWT